MPSSPTTEQPSQLGTGKKDEELFTNLSDDLQAEKVERDLSIPPSEDLQLGLDNDVPEPAPDAPPATQEQEWVSGFKLFTIMTAITLVCFLMLLDTSIIATVCVKTLYFLFATKKFT